MGERKTEYADRYVVDDYHPKETPSRKGVFLFVLYNNKGCKRCDKGVENSLLPYAPIDSILDLYKGGIRLNDPSNRTHKR